MNTQIESNRIRNGFSAKMSLKDLDDSRLIEQTENFVREEREILTAVLHHLREIDRRRLYSSMGYKSLFDFAVRHLHYSEDQAYRRISAMNLVQELPELEEKISSGELSLSHIGLAQSHFRQEKKIHQTEVARDQKLMLLNQIAKKPVREAERITFALSSAPEMAKPDRVTALSENVIEMKFSASADLSNKIEQLKGWLAHKYPNLSLGELFEKLCDLGIEEWKPAKVATSRNRRVKKVSSLQEAPIIGGDAGRHGTKPDTTRADTTVAGGRISKARIRREIFSRANNKCEICQSVYFLEVDHIQPRALGGDSGIENLRLLCRPCNQRAAIQKFGLRKMGKFLNLR